MTDFEIQRRLRDLRTPHEPSHDLFPQIARRIAEAQRAEAPVRRRRGLVPFAAAAAMALATTVGVVSLAVHDQRMGDAEATAMRPAMPSVREQIDRARELATSSDPRLASAEVVLDAATAELEQALEQQPDATFLVGLINRTHAQRRKLARLGLTAG